MLLLRLSAVGLAVYLGGVSVVQAATDCGAVTPISQIECESLLQLYQSTNGANWEQNKGWNVTNKPCGWFGVSCENNGVTAIRLTWNNLNGTLTDFRGLPNLHLLSLSGNQLTGVIPDFSGLPKLQRLFLNDNQLTGAIPDFSGLSKLQTLWLDYNQLSGTIPDFSGLSKLQTLRLDSNQLTGAIPDFSGLPQLHKLLLYGNQLTGAIPVFSGLPQLSRLVLSGNQLCQQLNSDYSQWQAQLQGFVICRPPTAVFTVSSASGKAPLTVQLDASGSADSNGTIVQYEWTVNGQTPVGEQTSATLTEPGQYTLVLTVTDNHGLTATTRKTVTATTHCQQVTGVSEAECESLLQLYQSTNGANWERNKGWNLTNTPCEWVGVTCDKAGVIELKLTQNNLTGTLAEFPSFPQLLRLFLNDNQLSGAMPNFSGLPKLLTLRFDSNQLTGTIPDFSGLFQLQTLSLSKNKLSGAIPNFSGLPQLQQLRLDSNQLTGAIPDFSDLPKLERLELQSNQLSGAIPDFSDLPELSERVLTENKLCKHPNTNDSKWQAQLEGFARCRPPAAAFTVSSPSGPAPLTVQLEASGSADSDGVIVQYEWTANGQTRVGQPTSVTFTAPGQYTLVLTVTDNDGLTATTRQTVTATINCQKVTGVSERECESLLQLYHSALGANWNRNKGWNVTNTPCEWVGVSCDQNGVTKIELAGSWQQRNNLNGTLPNFRGLPFLQRLDLSYNQLSGALPNFSGLPKLQVLVLSENQLTGAIPDFSGLPQLQQFALSNNNLSGALPNFSGLPQLLRLSLGSNQLTGALQNFSGLPKLERLELQSNQLTGAIPDFSGLPQLQQLFLNDNQLMGAIPDFSALPKLQTLWLESNQLTGTIPDFSALPNLQYLFLGKNQLMGAIPDFSGLPLSEMVLAENKLCKRPNTNYFHWQAQLEGFAICRPPTVAFTVSSASGKVPLAVQLDASGSADSEGAIVQYEWTVNGQTPVGEQTSASLTVPGKYTLVLTVTDNHGLTATTRQTVKATTHCQAVTGVSEAECESLLQLYQNTNGTNWYRNKGWNLTNTPCEWVGVTCDKAGVIRLELSQNNLTGTLAEFPSFPELQTLDLSKNQLSGAIPDFSGWPQLVVLSLSGNQLSGAIPDFSGLPQLERLELQSNKLTDAIPDFRGLPKLQTLSLAQNQLTGTIPDFSGLPRLQTLSLSFNQLTGAIPDFSGLPKLESLALYRNKLTGAIPDFSGLPKLQSLYLLENQLTGAIPDFSGLPQLQTLRLDKNQLTGAIPDFSGLTYLITDVTR